MITGYIIDGLWYDHYPYDEMERVVRLRAALEDARALALELLKETIELRRQLEVR